MPDNLNNPPSLEEVGPQGYEWENCLHNVLKDSICVECGLSFDPEKEEINSNLHEDPESHGTPGEIWDDFDYGGAT